MRIQEEVFLESVRELASLPVVAVTGAKNTEVASESGFHLFNRER